jgi:tryptophanyl-tRNA synthetase
VLTQAQAVVPPMARLPGIDGKAKMSKSLGNAIYLSDSSDVVAHKVMKMYTDPNHIHVNDPGQVEGNTVFAYLDLFDLYPEEVAKLKEKYQQGGLGDVVLKKRLIDVLNQFLNPIRERRAHYAQDMGYITQIVQTGTEKVRMVAQQTMREVRVAMQMNYW